MSKQKTKDILIILLVLLILLGLTAKQILNPGSYFFSSFGDGIKNYYAFMYHIRWGSGFRFLGINYPYHENILYIDALPLLSVPLSYLKNIIPLLGSQLIAILNLWMLFNIYISALLLYFILNHFRTPKLTSALAAIAITLLAPQNFRLLGHYALASSALIPMMILILLKLRGIKLHLASFMLCLAAGLIHPYLLAILLFLISIYFLADLINTRQLNYTTPICAGLAVISYFSIVRLTDFIPRSSPATGDIKDFAINLSGLLQPANITKSFFNPEQNCYPGLVAFLGIVIFLYLIFKKRILENYNSQLKNLLFCAILSLIFSSNISADLFASSNISIFRAIGRFSWIFFYTSNIIAFVSLQHLFQNSRASYRMMFPLILIFSLFEGYNWFSQIFNLLPQKNNVSDFLVTADSATNNLKGDWQGILPIPFYNASSDKLFMLGTSPSVFYSMAVSYGTAIPMFSNLSVRGSAEQSINQAELVANSQLPKDFIESLGSKAILITHAEGRTSENEKKLLQYSKKLLASEKLAIHELQLSDYQKIKADDVYSISQQLSSEPIYYDSLEAGNTGILGQAKYFPAGNNLLFSAIFSETTDINISLWGKLLKHDFSIYLDLEDSNKKLISSSAESFLNTPDRWNEFAYFNLKLNVPANHKVTVYHSGSSVILDELLIQKSNTNFTASYNNKQLTNNLPYSIR